MLTALLISCATLAFVAFLVACYAHTRIEKLSKSTDDLDWEAVAALTGDVGVVKRAIQKVNNRINGMERGEGVEAQAMQLLMQQQAQPPANNSNNGYSGG